MARVVSVCVGMGISLLQDRHPIIEVGTKITTTRSTRRVARNDERMREIVISPLTPPRAQYPFHPSNGTRYRKKSAVEN